MQKRTFDIFRPKKIVNCDIVLVVLQTENQENELELRSLRMAEAVLKILNFKKNRLGGSFLLFHFDGKMHYSFLMSTY